MSANERSANKTFVNEATVNETSVDEMYQAKKPRKLNKKAFTVLSPIRCAAGSSAEHRKNRQNQCEKQQKYGGVVVVKAKSEVGDVPCRVHI